MFDGDIAEVEIVFENCESISIYTKDIIQLHIDGEHKKIVRYSNALQQHTGIEQFAIVLNKRCLSEQTIWGSTLCDRLAMLDVTHVTLVDSAGHSVHYSVDWSEDDIITSNGQYSSNQRVQFTPKGHLIFISSTTSMIHIDSTDIDDKADFLI